MWWKRLHVIRWQFREIMKFNFDIWEKNIILKINTHNLDKIQLVHNKSGKKRKKIILLWISFVNELFQWNNKCTQKNIHKVNAYNYLLLTSMFISVHVEVYIKLMLTTTYYSLQCSLLRMWKSTWNQCLQLSIVHICGYQSGFIELWLSFFMWNSW